MPYSVIKEKISDYPIDERIMIADAALASLNQMDPAIEMAWGQLALKRLGELRTGAVQGISAGEVFTQARCICKVS